MTEKSKKMTQAIDLMLEDLHMIHVDIREQAKELKCEDELDELKKCLIGYLLDLKPGYN
jgi:hypothetical protein